MPCEKLNVVVIYDSAYARKAMVTYSRLERELRDACTLDLHLWRLDIAVAPEHSAQVGHDIADAELIIVAVHGSQPCPSAFQHWKRADGTPHSAIIALTEQTEPPAHASGSWDSVLRAAATPIHPEIFVWDSAAGAPQQLKHSADSRCAGFAGAGSS